MGPHHTDDSGPGGRDVGDGGTRARGSLQQRDRPRSVDMIREVDRGSAPVDFALVGVLLVAIALVVVQIAFFAHLRAVAIDSAIAGAAHAALADTTDSEGVARATALVSAGVAASLVRSVSVGSSEVAGKPIVSVTIRLAVPAIGPWLPLAETDVTGRAFREGPLTNGTPP